jgi:DNA-binding transcriptional ArsR family regulator
METTSITPSAAGLRALSHPTRLRMLMLLRLEGPATATRLARELKLNTGATSYHLRRLAEHGLIVEDTERGDARDRWWKAAHESTRVGMTARGEDEQEDVEAYLQTVALMYTETLMQAVAERRFLPAAWQEASTTSDWHIRLTPARAEELLEALEAVISRFWDTEEPATTDGAADFVVNLNAFPRPGTVVLEGDER